MAFLSVFIISGLSFLSYFFIKKGIEIADNLLGLKFGEATKFSSFILIRLFWTDSIKKYLPYLGTAFVFNIFIGIAEGPSEDFIYWIRQTVLAFIIIMIIFLVNRVLYNVAQLPEVAAMPNYLGITVVLEAVKLFLYFVSGILIIAYFTNQSLLSIMSALGAMTAVLILVFRDSILGLASGLQLSANKMLQIGDWIEIPSQNIDGVVLEIRLTTVKMRNWDNSVVNLPAYSLVQNPFKNWQGMIGSGGRRIKRSIFLDASQIRFLTPGEISKKIPAYLCNETFLSDKLGSKKSLQTGKKKLPLPKITNIELFRAYIGYYLRHHPKIHQEQTLMVRQLQSGFKGMPLEIYAFTNTTDWVEYETIQTEIFENLFAQAAEFGMEVFQDPCGRDFSTIVKK